MSLAFLGDGLFTFFVRDQLINRSNEKAGSLHVKAKRYVSAGAQAKMLDAVAPALTEDEADIARRARNTNNATRAKNAAPSDYKKATALEAVLGYLHLTERTERLEWLLARLMEVGGTDGKGAGENRRT